MCSTLCLVSDYLPPPYRPNEFPYPRVDIGNTTNPTPTPLAFYKAPAFVDQTDLSALTANLDAYNAALASNLATFKATNTDITLGQIFNTTSYFWDVLDDPTAYGLDSDTTAANADGTTAVWYDNYHPGQAIHKLVARGFVDALTGSFF